jgi:outer membrane protein assembly factor BamB
MLSLFAFRAIPIQSARAAEAQPAVAMFGGTPARNMVNTTAKDLPDDWNIKEGERKNVKWAVALGSMAYGGPVIAGGKVFVGTNNNKPRDPKIKGDKGVVMCFREADGEFLWQAVHDKLPNTSENDWPDQGVASAPAVEGQRLYYVSNRCELICADTEGFYDGKNDGVQDEPSQGKQDADIVWRLDMMKELGVYPHYLANCSPLVAGDLVFVVTGNGVGDQDTVPSPKAPSFLAVNKTTGKVVWSDNSPGDKIMEGQWTNPAYAVVNGQPQVIFPGGDGWLRGFEAATGKLIWKFDCNPKSATFKPGGRGTKNHIVGTPVVHDNKVYLGVGQNPESGPGVGHLWCIDITKKGDLSPVNDNFDPKADMNKNSGLVWHVGGSIVPKPKTGRDVQFGRTISTCAVHDGLVYAAELDGYVSCFDAATGKQYWQQDLKSDTWGSPYVADGKVYLGTNDGDIHIFAHDKEKKPLGKVEMDQSIHGTPVAVGKVLYVQTDAKLFALAKP